MHNIRIKFSGRGLLNGFAPALRSNQHGQSLIETCLAMFIICLIFFGLFQVSQMAAAREILHHAAARGARAKTVGFNHFMVYKAIRVAAIPNAGRMTAPAEFRNNDLTLQAMLATLSPGELWDTVLQRAVPSSLQLDIKTARIPEYMLSVNYARSGYILNYEDWDTINWHIPHQSSSSIIEIDVSQQYPLRLPFHRAFYAADSVDLHGVSAIENHYPLYLDDRDW